MKKHFKIEKSIGRPSIQNNMCALDIFISSTMSNTEKMQIDALTLNGIIWLLYIYIYIKSKILH